MIGARFKKLDLDKNHLVVKAFELLKQCVNERNGFGVGVFLEVEPDETCFEVLAEEGASLGDSPFDARSGDGDLDVEGVGDDRKKVNQLTD